MNGGLQKAGCGLRIGATRDAFALGVFKLTALCAFATNELANSDDIPPLRPAKPEISPGYWEQHAVLTLVAGFGVLVGLLLLWRLISRTTPAAVPAPATIARQSLQPLRERGEDFALLTEVSSILRRYFVAAFALPQEEFTNSELSRQLAHTKAGPHLASAASDLLQSMEHRRFDAEAEGLEPQAGHPSPARTVERALRLIDETEARLHPQPIEADPDAVKS